MESTPPVTRVTPIPTHERPSSAGAMQAGARPVPMGVRPVRAEQGPYFLGPQILEQHPIRPTKIGRFFIFIFFISVFYKNIFSIWKFTEIYPGRPVAGRPGPGRPTAGRSEYISVNFQIENIFL